MPSEELKIGDIVSIKAHPYQDNITTIIVSGEPLLLPPLMVITEQSKLQSDTTSVNDGKDAYEYMCLYFSGKTQRFEQVPIKGIHLKRIMEGTLENSLSEDEVFPGVTVTIKTMDFELVKKKSSFTFEDTSLNHGSDSSTITALLSYLPPSLQVISVVPHKSKHPTHKKDQEIRKVPSLDVKCFWYNSHKESLSEQVLPIEALQIVVPPNIDIIKQITELIAKPSAIEITELNDSYLIMPRLIHYRSGYYFLRGYNYVLNRITEHRIAYPNVFTEIENHVVHKVPEFKIEVNPGAASREFIQREIAAAIAGAEKNKNFIRIQYRNRNDVVTLRTLKNYRYVDVEEDGKNFGYLLGHCCLRMDERSFRIDRIQQLEELNFQYKKN
jgi:hypothetical protein